MEAFAIVIGVIILLVMVVSPFAYMQLRGKHLLLQDELYKERENLKSQEEKIQEFRKRNASVVTGLQDDVAELEASLASAKESYESRLEEKQAENAGLKSAVQAIANQFVNDSLKYVTSSLTANNYESSESAWKRSLASSDPKT